MKTILAVTAFLALVACKAATVPTAADNECRERHGLRIGTAEYADCIENLRHSESELRHAH